MHKIGKYTLDGSIGQGGNGMVYRSTHPVLNRPVAVKALHQKLAHDPELRERFLREARLTLELNHPGIVNVYDVDQDGERAFIAMELFEHGSLADALEEQAIPLPVTLTLAADIADALAYAHRQGVVHRDIKPSNVLLRHDGIPVLADFGLALDPFAVQASTPADGEVQGTPAYMAPEQIRGGATDARTDMYAFGVLLYELVSGRLPFEAPPALQIHGHLNSVPPKLRALVPVLPRSLDTLVSRMLAKDPAQRPSDMAAVAAELRLIRDALPAAAARLVRTPRVAAPVQAPQPPLPPLSPATSSPATDATIRLPAPVETAPPAVAAQPIFGRLPTTSLPQTQAVAPPRGNLLGRLGTGIGVVLVVAFIVGVVALGNTGPRTPEVAYMPEPALTPLPITVLETPTMTQAQTLVAGQERWTIGSVGVYEGQFGVDVYGVVRYDGTSTRDEARVRAFVRDPAGAEIFSVENDMLVDYYEPGDYGAFHVLIDEEYGPLPSTGQYTITFEIRSSPLLYGGGTMLRNVPSSQTQYGRADETSYAWETSVGGSTRRLIGIWAYVVFFGPDGRVVGVDGTSDYYGEDPVEDGASVRLSHTFYGMKEQPASMVVLTKADAVAEDVN